MAEEWHVELMHVDKTEAAKRLHTNYDIMKTFVRSVYVVLLTWSHTFLIAKLNS